MSGLGGSGMGGTGGIGGTGSGPQSTMASSGSIAGANDTNLSPNTARCCSNCSSINLGESRYLVSPTRSWEPRNGHK
jgi:hypothetical protein